MISALIWLKKCCKDDILRCKFFYAAIVVYVKTASQQIDNTVFVDNKVCSLLMCEMDRTFGIILKIFFKYILFSASTRKEMEDGSSTAKEEEDFSQIHLTSTPVRDPEDSRNSASPDREIQMEARIPAIMNRSIPGRCSMPNRGTLSWGYDGCLAYGAGTLVVVVDASSSQYLQVLSKHKHPVMRIAWSESGERRLVLASADANGHIVIWDTTKVGYIL